MKASTAAIALLLGALSSTMGSGCRNDGPVSVESTSVATQEPDFIKLPKNMSLQKFVADTALITPEQGGKLSLNFKYKYIASSGVERELKLNMTLTFPKGAVSDSLVAMIGLDDQVLKSSVDITFNPHGSTFLTPALLDVQVSGMDVAGLNPDDEVWLYYYEDGTWVKMAAKKVDLNFKKGELKCQDGQLPHFSRYAFGR
jgi:hypothetical protein